MFDSADGHDWIYRRFVVVQSCVFGDGIGLFFLVDGAGVVAMGRRGRMYHGGINKDAEHGCRC